MASTNIWDGIGTVVCDLDGVVYLGEEGIAGVGEALAALQADGIQLLFVTNNSTNTPEDAAAKISRTVGFPARADSVVTSAAVTAARLRGQVQRALVLGATAIDEALRAEGIEVTTSWEAADAVVVGLDREITYDRLSGAAHAIRAGAAFYATNTDSTYPTPQGLLPGGGSIVAAVATAAGVEPIVSGKPHPPMTEHVAELATGAILAVGDRANTDIAMARLGGWRSALVLTGVIKSLAEVGASEAPDLVVGSLAELVSLRSS